MNLFLFVFLNGLVATNGNSEKLLVESLFTDYNYNTLPIINNSYVDVSMGMALRAINKIDQIDGQLALNIWLRHWWYDEYLQWDPKDWNNISNIVLYTDSDDQHVIWTPDIYLYNTAEKPNDNLEKSRAMVNSSGNVIWSRPGIITSTCSFDLTSFPYDEQKCSVKFGSWSYNGNQLKLSKNILDTSSFQKHEEWDLVNHSAKLNIEYYTCCPEPYYDVEFSITIRRKPGFYILNVIIPTFATAALMLISLLIPWKSGERISFVITVMLAIIVFLLLLSENLPRSDNEPLLSRMIIGLVFFSLSVVFMTVLISYMRHYKHGKNKYIDMFVDKCHSCSKNIVTPTPPPVQSPNIEDSNINRTNSYMKSVQQSGVDSSDDESSDDDDSNTSERKKLINKECKKYALKIELISSIIIVVTFFIFCFVVHLMQPDY